MGIVPERLPRFAKCPNTNRLVFELNYMKPFEVSDKRSVQSVLSVNVPLRIAQTIGATPECPNTSRDTTGHAYLKFGSLNLVALQRDCLNLTYSTKPY